MVYIEPESPEDIQTLIQQKQVKLDSHINDCYSGAIIDAVILATDLGYYVDNRNITDEEYIIYMHELKESVKDFKKWCVCFKGSPDGVPFP